MAHFFQFDNLFHRSDFLEEAFNDPFFSTPLSGFFARQGNYSLLIDC
jgi:hypothetical protein